MGLASGKLTINPVEDKKTEENAEPIQKPTAPETASQLVNGDANAVSNVRPIDEEIEPTPEKCTETQPDVCGAVEQTPETTEHGDQPMNGVNGTVNASETAEPHEHEKKKSKNPLGWIKRRLSKKSSTTKRPSTDGKETENEGEAAEVKAEGSTDDPTPVAETETKPEMAETATSLVQDVLTSAAVVDIQETKKDDVTEAVQSTETIESPEKPHDVTETSVVESNDVEVSLPSAPCEPEHEGSEPTPEVQNGFLNGTHKTEEPEEMDVVEEYPAVDTNNTNGHENGSHVPDEVHDFDSPEQQQPTDDAIAAKLAGLELTNGHSDHINGDADPCPTNGVTVD